MKLYDHVFFEGKWKKLSEEKNICLSICWQERCFPTIAYCKTDGNMITIKLSSISFKKNVGHIGKYTEEVEKGNTVMLSGVAVDSVLKILLQTFEHELIHATISVFCPKFDRTNEGAVGTWSGQTQTYDGHTKTFMSIVNNVFGHTAYKVSWPEQYAKKEKALQTLTQLQEEDTPGNMLDIKSAFDKDGEEVI